MKRKHFVLLSMFCVLFIATSLLTTGCQSVTKNYGGTTEITLDPGLKLEEITWKNNSLWYLTRPMRDDETAETHTFSESSNLGVFEGTVIKIQGGSNRETFTVRKSSNGIGVEKTWPLHSPNVEKIEVVRKGKVRRAKLFYLRDRVGKKAKVKEVVR